LKTAKPHEGSTVAIARVLEVPCSSEFARTSSIDAEWDALASTPESELLEPPARPRLDTLPGLGPESEPALPALRSRKRPRLTWLASAALLTLIGLGGVTWQRANASVSPRPVPAVLASKTAAAPPPALVSAPPVLGEQPLLANVDASASAALPLPAVAVARTRNAATSPVAVRSHRSRRSARVSSDNPY